MRRKAERGNAAAEMAVLVAPVMILMFAATLLAGRIPAGEGDVQGAARNAARAASEARTPDEARAAAVAVVESTLRDAGPACRRVVTSVNTSNFRPGGDVTVRVTCDIDLSDASLLRVPPSKQVSAAFRSSIDLYRAAAP